MTKVFISWSGEHSRQVALALHDWLPSVLHSVEPFVSDKDIYAGSRWQLEIAKQLETTNFGLVCVTRKNQFKPWLNFEAGALAKAVDGSRVVPLAIDLKLTDVQLPLGLLQAKPATQEGLGDVLKSLNAAGDPPLGDVRLSQAIEVWWPRLEGTLNGIREAAARAATAAEPSSPTRTERDLIEETLNTIRSLARYEEQSAEAERTTRPRFAISLNCNPVAGPPRPYAAVLEVMIQNKGSRRAEQARLSFKVEADARVELFGCDDVEGRGQRQLTTRRMYDGQPEREWTVVEETLDVPPAFAAGPRRYFYLTAPEENWWVSVRIEHEDAPNGGIEFTAGPRLTASGGGGNDQFI